MSSDDELSSHDTANISKIRQDVENQARVIMSDVVEDFSNIEGVLSRMQAWKSTHGIAYKEAYASLCLHKMIGPLVTLQLLFWNPLEDHCNNIEDMDWFSKVAVYAAKIDSIEENDKDHMFLPLVIEKVVLVKIIGIVQAAYDPLSTCQSLRLSQLLHRLRNTYPTLTGSSKQVRELLTLIRDKFKNAIESDVYIPLGYSKQCLDNPASAHALFLSRQFWSAFKLFKNVLLWSGLLSDQIIVDLALSSLLYRYLMIGLGVTPNPVECVGRTRAIVNALPSEWKKARTCKGDLERFAKYLCQLGATVNLPRESVKDLVSQLKSIGAWSEADQLEKKILHNL